MSVAKFTQGEWVTRPGNTTVLDKKGNPVAMVYRAEFYRPKEESFANAALIKAAPDMYRLLEQLHGVLASIPLLQGEIEAVLKKARGGVRNEQ